MIKHADNRSWWNQLLLVPLVLVALLILPLMAIGYALWHFGLLASIWTFWCAKGRKVLFVYSDSPNWQEYVKQNILPRLEDSAVILNWSHRAKWSRSLAVLAFKHWGGTEDFNPLGVIFRPFKRTKVFRFHQAFLHFKHGKSADLEKMKAEFLTSVGSTGGTYRLNEPGQTTP